MQKLLNDIGINSTFQDIQNIIQLLFFLDKNGQKHLKSLQFD